MLTRCSLGGHTRLDTGSIPCADAGIGQLPGEGWCLGGGHAGEYHWRGW